MESAQHMQHRVEVCPRGRRSQSTLAPSSHLLRVQAPLPALTHGAEEDKSMGEAFPVLLGVWTIQDTISSLGCVLGENWAFSSKIFLFRKCLSLSHPSLQKQTKAEMGVPSNFYSQ